MGCVMRTKIVILIVLIGLLASFGVVLAQDYQGSVVITCDYFTASGTGAHILNRDTTGTGQEQIILRATDGAGRQIYSVSYSNLLGTYAGGIIGTTAWSRAPRYNPIIFSIISPAGNGFREQIQVFTGSCPGLPDAPGGVAGPPATNLYDGRINNSQLKDVAAPVAVYCTEEETIAIFKIDAETGEGTRVINHPLGDEPTPENQLLAEAAGVSLYLLSSGEYHISAPNFEFKTYTILWQGCDSSTLVHVSP